MLATLGDIVFEVSSDVVMTWQEASRSGAARWAEHDVHLGKPLAEFLGPGLDELQLEVRLDITRGLVPRDELQAMRRVRDTGEVLPMVIGGQFIADFTLRQLAEKWTRFDANGVLLTAVATLTLKEHV
jgi:phage protein U